jgi:glutathione S-transferase
MFAPVVMRLNSYRPPRPPAVDAYCQAIEQMESVRAWCAAARLESEFVAADEPYAI